MIYRLSLEKGFTRVNELASSLNVQPPSVTKMIKKLDNLGFIEYEKYNIIKLKEKGEVIGKFLLDRHNTLESFLQLINVSNLLEETEKIEHTLNDEAVIGIKVLLKFFNNNPSYKDELFLLHNQHCDFKDTL